LDQERSVFGPHLKGIIGRKAAFLPDYAYSDALRAAGEAGLVWDEQALRDFLYSPKTKVPGTKMRFWGLWREEIDDLIAYLMSAR
jgi:cytochrome c